MTLKNDEDYSGTTVVIAAAGAGRRMRSRGPKALLELTDPSLPERPAKGRRNDKDFGTTILGRQIASFERLLPGVDVLVVVGFEAERICRRLPAGPGRRIRVVENESWETTNVARSLEIALRCSSCESLCLIHGDLVFAEETLEGFLRKRPKKESRIAWSPETTRPDDFRDSEVGCTVVDGFATRFDYGLENKWAQIAWLAGRELALCRRLVGGSSSGSRRFLPRDAGRDALREGEPACDSQPPWRRRFAFEILNDVVDHGGLLAAVPLPEGTPPVVEVDSPADISRALALVAETSAPGKNLPPE